MLVLSRKPGEEILIGESSELGIKVKVLEVRGDRVRLGITAPEHVSIDRAEIWAMVDEELHREEIDFDEIDGLRDWDQA